jgi:hypothetical protein
MTDQAFRIRAEDGTEVEGDMPFRYRGEGDTTAEDTEDGERTQRVGMSRIAEEETRHLPRGFRRP